MLITGKAGERDFIFYGGIKRMAKMDREFLVPYLRDICALYYALNKVNSVRSEKQSRLWRIENEVCPSMPAYPKLKPEPAMSYFVLIGAGIGGIAAALLAILFIFLNPNLFTIILGLGAGFVALMLFVTAWEHFETIKSVKESNENSLSYYRTECRSLEERKKAWRERQGLIPGKKSEIAFLEAEQEKIQTLLLKVYSINIIPKQYRDFYTAVYLYDFFETSYEDDVSVALGLYALEQIKEKLDIIISNQSEMLLNQYTMLAEQREAREEQAEHNRRMQNKVDGLQSSMDEITRSQRIVESNSDTAAFFAQATYFRSF